MGYTWEAWALDPAALVLELGSPTVPVARVRVDPLDHVVVHAVQQWDSLATAVAGAVREGGGDLTGDLATYVVALVRTLGRFAGSVGHTSSGGSWFRDDVLGRQVAGVLGRRVAVHLVARELAGLTVVDGPMLGWLSVAECAEQAPRSATGADHGRPDDEEALDVLDAVTRAAALHTGLVTVYV